MRNWTRPLLGVALLTVSLAACGGGDGDKTNSSAPKTAPAAEAPAGGAQEADVAPGAVKISQSSFGDILTDSEGRTLYAFTKDKDGESVCSGDCIATWPALTTKSGVKPGEGVDAKLLDTTKR